MFMFAWMVAICAWLLSASRENAAHQRGSAAQAGSEDALWM
jgi:hypothetical protein